MLFLLNKTQPDTIGLIKLLGGDVDKEVLLTQDAAFYATSSMQDQFHQAGIAHIYVAQDALETRAIERAPECQVVDYDRIVELVMEEHDQVVCI
ncbi:MAG: hypothetical protein FJ009_09505 [Chloroflexi bacterium]|nr:hypothetical protein [Chloroflexota bacterium]